MITDDEVMALFERADPARARDAAPAVDPAHYLADLRAGDEVTIVEVRPPTLTAGRSDLRLVRVAAAAAVIIVVAVALVLATRDDSDSLEQEPAATGEPDLPRDGALELASEFVDAFGRLDVDRVTTFLASDADLSGLIGSEDGSDVEGSAEELESLLSLLEAQRYSQVADASRCERLATSATTMTCPFSFHLLGSDALGLGPFAGGRFEVTVRGEEVVRASLHWDVAEVSFDIWEPFVEWVSAQRPADLELMYADSTHRTARRTEESVQRWQEHVDAYVGTGRSYIDRARAICDAAPPQVPNGSELYSDAFGRVLERTLLELRAMPPPLPVRAQFDHAYSIAERLADAMLAARSGPDVIDLIHELERLPGMRACTFYGPR